MRRKRKILYSLLFLLLLVVSLFYFTSDLGNYYKVKQEYKEIRKKVKKEKKIDWEELWKINKDIIAWIEIPDTPIDYPVVQTKSNSEYLSKNISGSYSIYGSIFLDARLYGSKLEENPNNIIYGHNMGRWTDVMFGSLKEYLNKGYLKGHKYVNLYTPNKTYEYRIESVEYAVESSSVYKVKFKRRKEFANWLLEQVSKSIYSCSKKGIINSYVDCFTSNNGEGNLQERIINKGNTLTLSTCDTTHDDRRKIVLFCIPK